MSNCLFLRSTQAGLAWKNRSCPFGFKNRKSWTGSLVANSEKYAHSEQSEQIFLRQHILYFMDGFFIIVIVFLLLNIALGLIRVWRGPTVADRLLTTQLFGTTGIAILLILAGYLQELTLLNVAITFNVLAILLVIGLVQVWKNKKGETP